MKDIACIFISVVVLIVAPPRGNAQDTTNAPSGNRRAVIVDFSAGFGAIENMAYTVNGELRYQYGHQLFTSTLFYTREFGGFMFIQGSLVREKVFSMGVLYGRVYEFHMMRPLFPFFPLALMFKSETDYSVSASVGAAYTRTTNRGPVLPPPVGQGGPPERIELRKGGISFPIEFEIVQHFSPKLAYVHRVYGNISNPRTSWGLLFGVQLYFLREEKF